MTTLREAAQKEIEAAAAHAQKRRGFSDERRAEFVAVCSAVLARQSDEWLRQEIRSVSNASATMGALAKAIAPEERARLAY